MHEKQIVDFIQESRKKGATDLEIKNSLQAAGWDLAVIEESFNFVPNLPSVATTQVSSNISKPNDGHSLPEHMIVAEPAPHQPSQTQAVEASSGYVQPQVTNVLPEMGSSVSGKKGILKKLLLFLGIPLIVLFFASAGLAYAVFGMGKTVLKYNAADEMWKKFVEEGPHEIADRDVSIAYVDKGEFVFLPSKFAEMVGESLGPEADEYDNRFKFTLKDPQWSYGVKGYINVADQKHPKMDVVLKQAATNNGITYEGSLAMKYKEPAGFFKVDFNSSVKSLISRFSPEAGNYIELFRDKWFKVGVNDSLVNSEDIGGSLNILDSLASARQKSRDAKRLSDVRQIASALELYFNDCQQYPEGQGVILDSKNGLYSGVLSGNGCTGGGISSKVEGTTYIQKFPDAPLPADGLCSDEMNLYRYVAKKNGGSTLNSSYQLTFCLGGKTGGYEAGNNVLTENGIDKFTSCIEGVLCKRDKAQLLDNPLKELVKNNRFFDIESFKGVTKVNGVFTMHYKLNLNKEKLKFIANEFYKEAMKDAQDVDPKNKEIFDKVLKIYLDKWNITDMHVYVGVMDKKIYKATVKSNMVSAVGAANLIKQEFENGNIKKYMSGDSSELVNAGSPGDAKRLADIRQMASALELYYNDHEGYPEAVNGKPQALVPNYVSVIPVQPEPPDGVCTSFYNNYWYSPAGSSKVVKDSSGKNVKVYSEYKYSFCLGATTGGYQAGNHYLSPSGISDLTDCGSTHQCYENGSSGAPLLPQDTANRKPTEEEITNYLFDLFKKIPWTASFDVESSAKDFNVVKEIQDPPNSVDLEEEIKRIDSQQELNRS